MGVLLSAIVYLVLRFLNYILDRKLEKQKRTNALLALENLKLSYDILMLCRKRYHEAKYIENSEERIAKQEELRIEYEKSIKTLSDPDYIRHKEYLTDTEKAELDEILSRPRYGLI